VRRWQRMVELHLIHLMETKVVKVILQGACSGPSSTFTLKSGIENMLKKYVKTMRKIQVEAINKLS
jgi:Fe-S cluster biogenesis protein NfuA